MGPLVSSGVEALDPHPVIGRNDVCRAGASAGSRSRDRCAGWSGSRVCGRIASISASASSRLKCDGCGAIAQRVDDPDVEPFEQRPARLRNAFDVRRVGEVPDAEPERVDLAVVEVERRRLDRAARALDPARAAGTEPADRSPSEDRNSPQASRKHRKKPSRTLSAVGSSMWMSMRAPRLRGRAASDRRSRGCGRRADG